MQVRIIQDLSSIRDILGHDVLNKAPRGLLLWIRLAGFSAGEVEISCNSPVRSLRRISFYHLWFMRY